MLSGDHKLKLKTLNAVLWASAAGGTAALPDRVAAESAAEACFPDFRVLPASCLLR